MSKKKPKGKGLPKRVANERPASQKATRQQEPIPTKAEEATELNAASSQLPVVGIGASAGGLSAFKKFFSKVPTDSGMAFVLVPHLDPTHESLMAELLARQTAMPVCEAADGMAIAPNCVYIIPPNKYLAIAAGKLQLSIPAERHGAETAIDFFFRSLAAEKHERAIGIILSGTSSHGTLGLKEIKLFGGMVMVQQPESADYDQMPRSAVATGLVDFVLPPEQMPDALVKYVRHPYVKGTLEPTAEEAAREQLGRILAMLKARTKYDFRSYRKNMLLRRVQRRMGLCHIEQMPAYLDYLRENPDEVTNLYKDLLIGVTGFFREPEAFQVLQQRVIPELIERRLGRDSNEHVDNSGSLESGTTKTIRVWTPGCATGEEAYTLAMLFVEQFAAAKQPADLQIFATDIDERSLETARLGIYSEHSTAEISPERLLRFFVKTDAHHWQVNKQLRESITFAAQNLISDAPFSKLDLISCRNLLIYLEPEVQAKVIRLFHFALAEGGYLLLGPSESIGREVDLFEPISKKWRVFRRIGPQRRNLVDIPIVSTDEHRRLRIPHPASTQVPAIGFKELMQREILNDYAPASVLINRKHEILCVLGPLVNYLEFPPGEITKDLLAMARLGLRTKLRAAIHKAIQTGEPVTDADARVKREGGYAPCSINVKPITEPKDAAGLLLVTFADRAVGQVANLPAEPPHEAGGPSDDSLVQHLEEELKSSREDLQSTVEEYESSTEELKASHEEVMSMNEELQSANEELETSKEELQSLNEELSTVNSQLQEKVEELDKSNSDLTNLMTSSDVATIFLDTELRIKRFTPPTAKLLNLLASDIGRPLGDFSPKFSDETLLDDCRAVPDKLTPIEKEVWTENGERCYLRRILPYRTADNRIDGVVITLVDITSRTAAEARSRRLATVLWDSNDAVTLQNFDGQITAWNRGAEQMYGYSESEALQMNIRDIVPEDNRVEAIELIAQLNRGEGVAAFETQRRTKDGRILHVWLTATVFCDEQGRPIGVATTERDITDRKRAAAELKQLNDSLEQRVAEKTQEVKLLAEAMANLGEGVLITTDHLDWPGPEIVYVNDALCRITGYTVQELIGQTPRILQGRETDKEILRRLRQELSAGRSYLCELVNKRKDGTPYDAELFITPLFDANGKHTNFIAIHRDITERKQAEFAQKESEAQFRGILSSLSAHIAVVDRDGTIAAVNPAWEEFARENDGKALSCNVGANYLEVCRSATGACAEEALQAAAGLQAVLDGEANQFKLEYPCHSATQQRWFLLHITPLRSPEGGAVVSHTNITDRVLAEQLVRDREERLRTILETAADAIITIDQRGIIDGVNSATQRMFGYSQSELIGQNVKILIPSPYRDEHDGYIARYLATGEARIIGTGRELSGRRKDGSTFPIGLAVSEVGHLGLFTGIIRDISDRRNLQKQVLEIAAEEDRRIGHELHDNIQQQLTGLGLLAQGQAEALAKEASQQATMAARLAKGIQEAANHVHLLSRGLVPVEVDAEGLRSALTDLAATVNEQYGVQCIFQCAGAVELSDNFSATHLYRIAQEAVNNALKHGAATLIEISLNGDNESITMKVVDNGIGIGDQRRSGPGMGLQIMEYRSALIGGTLQVAAGQDSGTVVSCNVLRGGG